MKRLLETSVAAVLGNDDLLAKILLCLPLKSLVPSKFVSKQWLSLITSPYFSGRLNPNPNFLSGMFLERSSNDHLNSDPKVCYVPINNNTDNAKNQDISSTAIAIFNENPDFYVLRSCKVNWISGSGRDLLQFNINQEVFKKISMPPVLHGNGNGNDNQGGIWDIKYFGASEDHLNLVISGITGFKIYEMEKDCSGWFVKYCVDLHKVIHALPQMILSFGPNKFCSYSILGIVGRENDDESFLVLHTPGNIISKILKSSHNRYVMLLCNGCGGYPHPLLPLLQCD
ncbi:hypothetical protein TEA_007141 [Camellia sinensis var. sinensis]|uniref:F-box domain-containing protein n=1 Tax=Camellia sinensis var. sinensis TaxID=542762 RepID=A0A4S4DGY8_CAMSN|nr:hypothetical protein TEA_007141 [Camellia sinensis var. sinensis]